MGSDLGRLQPTSSTLIIFFPRPVPSFLQVPDVDGILDRLLLFLGYDKPWITAETLIQMTHVLRRYPDAAEACVESISAIDPEVCLECLIML